jgi:hypothetical protein
MKIKNILGLITVFFLISACNILSPNNPNSAGGTQTVIPTQPTSGLTIEALKNSVYTAPQFNKQVQLKNGKYFGSDANGSLIVDLLPQVAFGDLNGDGEQDAAILLAENGGGSGTFISLISIVSEGKQFSQAAAHFIDDRPIINELSIVDSKIHLDAVVHGVGDSMVQPTLGVKETFQLINGALIMIKQNSTISGGVERSINITSPTANSTVGTTLKITGSMPIAPFENNLSFKVYDLSGKELFNSGFMVSSADVGQPANFDNTVTLPALPSGSLVRLELAELSMADGSMLTMDSILVKIQ